MTDQKTIMSDIERRTGIAEKRVHVNTLFFMDLHFVIVNQTEGQRGPGYHLHAVCEHPRCSERAFLPHPLDENHPFQPMACSSLPLFTIIRTKGHLALTVLLPDS